MEEADGGTLFLDEIGDLSPSMQTKLLRLLQEGEYKPVGSVTTHQADIRFIAATNHNLQEDIKNKLFREDLFYRLNVIQLEMPHLCQRREDIPLLAHFFLHKYSAANNKNIQSISRPAMRFLMGREYPGNVRELENIIERGVIFCETETLTLNELNLHETSPMVNELHNDIFQLPFREAKSKVLENFHWQYIDLLLEKSGGNISKAADLAGIQRQYLHRLLNEAGINTDEYKTHKEEQ